MASIKASQDFGTGQDLQIHSFEAQAVSKRKSLQQNYACEVTASEEHVGSVSLHSQSLTLADLWVSLPAFSKLFLILSLLNGLVLFGFGAAQIFTGRAPSLFLLVPLLLIAIGYLACVIESFYEESSAELVESAFFACLAAGTLLYYMIVQQRSTDWIRFTAITLTVAQVGMCILTYAVYAQFGWRLYSKLACDYRIKDAEKRLRLHFRANRFRTLLQLDFQLSTMTYVCGLLTGLNFGGDIVNILQISSSSLGWILTTAWLTLTYWTTKRKDFSLAKKFELALPLTYILLVVAVVAGFDKVSRQQHASSFLLVLGLMCGGCRTAVWADMRKLVEQVQVPGELETLSLASSRAVDPKLLPLVRGAWLGKPSAKNPHKKRFFQLSNDGSTLRWAWKKYILLYYVTDISYQPDQLMMFLHLTLEPDLCLRFSNQELYDTWQTGLAVVLQYLLGPEEAKPLGRSASVDQVVSQTSSVDHMDSVLRRTGSGPTLLRRLGSFPLTTRSSLLEPDRDEKLQQAQQHAKSVLKAARLFTDDSSPQIKAMMHNTSQSDFAMTEERAAHMRTNSTQESHLSEWLYEQPKPKALAAILHTQLSTSFAEEATQQHAVAVAGSSGPDPPTNTIEAGIRKKPTRRALPFSGPSINTAAASIRVRGGDTEVGDADTEAGTPTLTHSRGTSWGFPSWAASAAMSRQGSEELGADPCVSGVTAHVEVVVHTSEDAPCTPRPSKLLVARSADEPMEAVGCLAHGNDATTWQHAIPFSPGGMSSYSCLPTPIASPWKDPPNSNSPPDEAQQSAFTQPRAQSHVPSASYLPDDITTAAPLLHASQSNLSLSLSTRDSFFQVTSRNPSLISSSSSLRASIEEVMNGTLAKGLPLQMAVESISYEDLMFGQFLGKGAEGFVYAAMYRDTPVAVKKTGSSNEVEMNLLAGSHDNIVALRGLCQHKGNMFLVMEYCPRGTLDVLLHKTYVNKWEPQKLLPIIRGIARGMYHLSSRKPPIMHRDLKPANIFISRGFQAKIGDFGMSRTLGATQPQPLERTLTPGVIGTAAYCAPEVLAGETAPDAESEEWLKADVFSFGVTLWEMLERRRPFEGMDNFQIQTQWMLHPEEMRLQPITIADGLDPNTQTLLKTLSALVEDCTALEASRRPHFRDVVQRLRNVRHSLTVPTPAATPSPAVMHSKSMPCLSHADHHHPVHSDNQQPQDTSLQQ